MWSAYRETGLPVEIIRVGSPPVEVMLWEAKLAYDLVRYIRISSVSL
jgi:hypothetical protein